jgi:hypothetical protein
LKTSATKHCIFRARSQDARRRWRRFRFDKSDNWSEVVVSRPTRPGRISTDEVLLSTTTVRVRRTGWVDMQAAPEACEA